MSSDTKDARFALIADDFTKAGTDGAGRNFDKLKRKVDDFGASGSKAGNDFSRGLQDAVDRGTPATVKKFNDMGSKAGKSGGKHAGDEFIKGLPLGIGAGAVGLGKVVVGIIDRLTPEVAKEAAVVGTKAGEALVGGMATAASSAAQDVPALFSPEGAIGAAVVAVIAVGLAPALGAAVAAAVVGAVGFGFLGIGALILKNNPIILSALASLKSSAKRVFSDAAQPLVIPFTTAIDIIELKMQALGPSFRQIFTALAPAVVPLTTAFTNIFAAFTPGLVEDAKTFTAVFTDPNMLATIESLGPDINAFFSTVSKHKQLIIDAFKGIIVTVEILFGTLNVLINVAAWIDTAFHTTWSAVTKGAVALGSAVAGAFRIMVAFVLTVLGSIVHGAASAFGWVPGLGGKLKTAAKQFDTFAAGVNKSLANIKNVTKTVTVKVSGNGKELIANGKVTGTFGGPRGWSPFRAPATAPARTEPAREVSTTTNVNSTLVMDRRVLASVSRRVVNGHARRQKVGVR